MLKKIEAIIREDKINDVKEALSEIGIVGLNMFEIRGHGRQGGVINNTREQQTSIQAVSPALIGLLIMAPSFL
jgi:nitrogen regulatory protein P-II 1